MRRYKPKNFTLSSGLNKNKKLVDILSYKLSVLIYKIEGEAVYKLISNSFNKNFTKSGSKLNKDIKILDAKGFGPIHRFIDDAEDLNKSSGPNKIENNNVYNSLLNFSTKTGWKLDHIAAYDALYINELEENKINKNSDPKKVFLKNKAMNLKEHKTNIK